jgi:hypothetical protein
MLAAPLLRTPGARVFMKGDVTTNQWVLARSASELEKSLGFSAGRLGNGWTVLVLKQKLQPADFELSGLTLRSGGRLGLPASNPAVDKTRTRVSDEIMFERSSQGYERLQKQVLQSIPEKGDGRIVKVVPAIRHSNTLAPSEQYPMGGGGLQWTLVRDCEFLVAMTVDRLRIARIPGFSTILGEFVPYEDRAKLARYLMNA